MVPNPIGHAQVTTYLKTKQRQQKQKKTRKKVKVRKKMKINLTKGKMKGNEVSEKGIHQTCDGNHK